MFFTTKEKIPKDRKITYETSSATSAQKNQRYIAYASQQAATNLIILATQVPQQSPSST